MYEYLLNLLTIYATCVEAWQVILVTKPKSCVLRLGDTFSKRIFSYLDIPETGVLVLYISCDVLSIHNFQK